MLTLGGLAFLFACVFGSFIATGGAIGPLMGAMPFELLTILGAAIGTFVMANSMHDLKHTLGCFGLILKGEKFHKKDYVDLLSLLYFFTRLASQRGAMALEPHIEKPEESKAFNHFEKILQNHHTTAFICDYLRMIGMNADDPHQIEDVMARELKKTLQEELHASHAIQTIADALPALGIVAAVLGEMIGGALVGTFLGVLLAYGMAAPCATRIKGIVEADARYNEVIRAVLVAHLHGNAPQVSVETGRKMVPNQHMPSFADLEQALQALQVPT
jgi:chemotaxis protein MotA